MSGKHQHDDSLERLFQKKAEEYDISYRDEDWHKLERRLDARDAQLLYRRRLIGVAAAAMLIIGFLGYFTYDNHTRLNNLTEQIHEGQVADEQPSIIDPTPEPVDRTAVDRVLPGLPERDLLAITEDLPRLPLAVAEEEQDEFADEITAVRIRQLPATAVSSPDLSPVVPKRVDIKPEAETDEQMTGPPLLASEEVELPDRQQKVSRFSLGLVGAPDLTTVGSVSNLHTPGYKFGLTAEYQLSSRLAISTGIVHSTVRYSDRSEQYQPPGYLSGGVAPNEITGECIILDVPITLKLDVLTYDNSRIFATAGVSSYIMLNEEYNFNYENQYNEERIESWSDRTGTRHWLSNAGFSVGYEYDVHPSWSVRAEPFIRIPMQEVGWANVRLFSMGSFVSINYRL